jgi:hypothetical protein
MRVHLHARAHEAAISPEAKLCTTPKHPCGRLPTPNMASGRQHHWRSTVGLINPRRFERRIEIPVEPGGQSRETKDAACVICNQR